MRAAAPVASLRLLGAVFFFSLGGVGAWAPYGSVFMERSGYSGAAIASVLSILPLARILSGPFWSAVGDRYQRGAQVLFWASLASGLAALAMIAAPGGALALSLGYLAVSVARAPTGAIVDALTLQGLERSGQDPRAYGRYRLWGSVGFLLAAVGGALLVDHHPHPAAPLVLGGLLWVVQALVGWSLPDPPRGQGPVRLGPALLALRRQPFFLPFLLGLCCAGVGLTAFDAYFALHIRHLGLPSAWGGAAIGLGIAVEIAVMARGEALLRRLGSLQAVALAFAVGSLRWLLTGLLSDPLALVLVQASHGVAFGLFWLGAVQVMRERAPDEIRASAQSLVGTSAYCVGPLLNAVQVGLLLESQGTSAIFVLCAIWSALASALVLLAIRREAAHVSRGAASRGARSTEAAP